MLYQVIEDGEITQSYSMPDHDDTHHLVTAGNRQAIKVITTNKTLDETYFTVIVNANSAARTVTLPPAASNKGRIYNIKKNDASANTVTIDGNGTETIDHTLTQVLAARYDSYTIQSDGSNWWII